MSSPFFSIIIPAYNTVQYLGTCIDSLLTQSCGDFEIVLMDDASTDGTGELADQLAARDGRIRVFHIAHAGVSGARNAGIQAAEGEYALFLDSDDVLVPDALERIKAKLYSGPDMMWFGLVYRSEDGSEREGPKLSDIRYASASEAAMDWFQKDIQPLSASNKVYRLPVIRKFGIVFREEFFFGEDGLFNLDFLNHCGQIVTSSDNLYVYIMRDGSASHRFVPGMLSVRLALHKERMSALRPLYEGKLSEQEWQIISETEYVKDVKSAWARLIKYHPPMTREEMERELRPYLDICLPKKLSPRAAGHRSYMCVYMWFIAMKIAVGLNSLTLLRLMMFVSGLGLKKGT